MLDSKTLVVYKQESIVLYCTEDLAETAPCRTAVLAIVLLYEVCKF